jgi:hypothetical protein
MQLLIISTKITGKTNARVTNKKERRLRTAHRDDNIESLSSNEDTSPWGNDDDQDDGSQIDAVDDDLETLAHDSDALRDQFDQEVCTLL